MATAVTQQESDHAYKAHRTQAIPKNSLFGTSLEINKEDKVVATGKPAEHDKKVQKQQELPDHLKPLLKSNDEVIRKRLEFDRQKDVVRQSKNDLKAVESKALAFDPDPKTTTRGSRSTGSRNSQIDKTHQWFTRKDIDHVQDINIGGLTSFGSYNRDKYGRKRPTHLYSQMGDVLQPGMEFTPRERQNCNQNGNTCDKTRLRTNLTNNMELPSPVQHQPSPHSVVPLPPNIRHMFGSKICDELLSDEKKVNDTIEKQERVRAPPRRGRRAKTPEFEQSINPGYYGLSNATRQNVFPGYTAGHKKSITKTVYSDTVFDERYPDPDEFRYQRDQLSKWAEHNVLRERMKKAWDLKLEAAEKKS